MKVFAKSGDGNWIKIGNSFSDAEWYNTQKVKNFIQNINKGDEVEIRSSKNNAGKNVLDYISKSSTSTANPTSTTTSVNTQSVSKDEEIKRMSVLRAAAEAIQVMTGQISDINTLSSMIEQLYDRLYRKINE